MQARRRERSANSSIGQFDTPENAAYDSGMFLLSTLSTFLPTPALAYIGPGAGFAFVGSFLILFVAVLLAMISILSFPFRLLFRSIFRKRAPVIDGLV